MDESHVTTIGCVQYELEFQIKADPQLVWDCIIKETNAWWLPDFRMVDASSTVEFDICPGGRGLIESHEKSGFLVWYSVQFYQPEQFRVYLVGNIAPDWGGPSTSNLCLALEKNETGCELKVTDAHHGRVSEAYIHSLKEGWNRLFSEGLRSYVESRS